MEFAVVAAILIVGAGAFWLGRSRASGAVGLPPVVLGATRFPQHPGGRFRLVGFYKATDRILYQGDNGAHARQVWERQTPREGEEFLLWDGAECRGHKGQRG